MKGTGEFKFELNNQLFHNITFVLSPELIGFIKSKVEKGGKTKLTT
jgi:hypothetical protein